MSSVIKKGSAPEEVEVVLAGFPEQLDVITWALSTMKKEIEDDFASTVNDPARRKQMITNLSRLISEIEGSLQEMRKTLQEFSGEYTVS